MTIMVLTDFKTEDLLPQGGFTCVVQFKIKFPKGSFVYGSCPKQWRLDQGKAGPKRRLAQAEADPTRDEPPADESQSFILSVMQSWMACGCLFYLYLENNQVEVLL